MSARAHVDRFNAAVVSGDWDDFVASLDPGAIMRGRSREFCRSWPNQREIIVKGKHFLQEDSPEEIGRALAEFVRELAGSELQRAASSAGLEEKS